jgi:protein SCO1/2
MEFDGSRVARIAILVPILLLLGGCRNSPATYTLTGRVIGKEPATQQLIIDNDNMPGFMAAMTMPYIVKDPEGFQRVQPTDVIRADVIVEQPGRFWLEHLTVIGKAASKAEGKPPTDGPAPQLLMTGDKVPDVPMVNQDGRTIHFSDFKGKTLLITFVYTRCPFPDYCPLITSHFAAIQNDLEKSPTDYEKTHLFSISLDPNYDKPAIMRQYGLTNMNHDPRGFGHWDFVSTSSEDLQKLTGSFGLSYSEQSGQIVHSMNTILLAADGTVADMWPGNEWAASEVLAVMRHAIAAGGPSSSSLGRP